MSSFSGTIVHCVDQPKWTRIKIHEHPKMEFIHFKNRQPQVLFKGCIVHLNTEVSHTSKYKAKVIKDLFIKAPNEDKSHVDAFVKDVSKWIGRSLQQYIDLTPMIVGWEEPTSALTYMCLRAKDKDNKAIFNMYNANAWAKIRDSLAQLQDVYLITETFYQIKKDVKAARHSSENIIPFPNDKDLMKVLHLSITKTYEDFIANPFNLSRHGIVPFGVTDQIAKFYNVSDLSRCEAYVIDALHVMMSNDGSTCFNASHVIPILNAKIPHDLKPHLTHVLETSTNVCFYTRESKKYLYLTSVFKQETAVLNKLGEYIETSVADSASPLLTEAQVDEGVKAFQSLKGFELDKKQRFIVDCVLTRTDRLFVLTGLPGSGKSSVVECVKFILTKTIGNDSYIVMAPTGKAANRIGSDASTIHRALEVIVDERTQQFHFTRNRSQPFKEKLVIIDEASMLDLEIFYNVLEACNPENSIIWLLGDPNQLPSISAGNVLRDLTRCNDLMLSFHLKQIHRQAQGNDILHLARAIIKGAYPQFETYTNVHFKKLDQVEQIMKYVTQLYNSHLKSGNNLQILIPYKVGMVGTRVINKAIHNMLYPGATPKNTGILSDIFPNLECDDKVIITSNYYVRDDDNKIDADLSVYNGDSGVFKEYIEDDQCKVVIGNKEVTVDLKIVDFGYAITIHKAQGSEYENVCMVMHPSFNRMLNREIFYTGVTRAKELLYIVGTTNAIQQAIRNCCPPRLTLLADRLMDMYEVSDAS